MIPRRLIRPLALVGILALGAAATGCSSTMNDAATITYKDRSGTHTVHVTRAELESELRGLAHQSVTNVLRSALKAGDGKNSTDAGLTAFWLGLLIREKVNDALFAEHKLKVSPFDTANAAAFEAGNLIPGQDQNAATLSQELYHALPTSLQNALNKHASRMLTLARSTCHSGKAIGGILVTKKAQANAIVAAVNENPANFEKLVPETIDAASKQSNGLLGCFDPADWSTSGATLDAAPPNKPVGPIQIGQNYAVFVLTPWNADMPDTTSSASKSVTQEDGDLTDLLLRATVHVDPRFGTWQSGVNVQGPFAAVAPPNVTNPRECRETTCPTTTTTTTIPQSGG
jgi:hypothetical protein